MKFSKYGNELKLILLLTGMKSYTAQELAEKLNITRRNLYYYFDYFRDSGFILRKQGTRYHLDPTSSFFKQLHENISMTEAEALFVHRILGNFEQEHVVAQNLKLKLERAFNLEMLTNPVLKRQVQNNVSVLRKAMDEKKMVMLHGYSSPHSGTVSNRIVEPFAFMSSEQDVRCYELKSKQNKTFKISRAADVELLDAGWLFEDAHRQLFTDMFMFSGEEIHEVVLQLDQLSYNLLLEEYPQAEPFVSESSNGSGWTFSVRVASFLGLGRFVMGLFEHVRIVEGAAFKDYLRKLVRELKADF